MSTNLSVRPVALAGLPLGRVAQIAHQQVDPTAREVLITGVSLDSGRIRPGDLFAALPGTNSHGAQWAAAALEQGAAAVLTDAAGAALIAASTAEGHASAMSCPIVVVDRPRAVIGEVSSGIYGRPSTKLEVYGITGTSGKTTTSFLLEAALKANGLSTGMIGTVETHIAGEVVPSMLTTPEAPDLQALFAVMAERGVAAVAMEVSSHALALGRVSGTEFTVGAFTNLSQDHLDFHSDMEDYFRAKALLFDGRAKLGVISVDDDYGARLAAEHPAAVTTSTDPRRTDSTWGVVAVSSAGLGSQRIAVRGPNDRQLTFDLALPGAFNVANALMTLACIDAGGHDVGLAAEAMSTVVVPGRMQPVDLGQDFLAIVDYAHKPAALKAVLEAVRPTIPGRIIVVVGAGGDRDRAKRPMMGLQAANGADYVIITDDNPRTEDPAVIRAQVLAGTRDVTGAQVYEIGDRAAAITKAVALALPGDAVVIAGKGHELGQYEGGQVRPFSDVTELAQAIRQK